jgi:hypothetical protein
MRETAFVHDDLIAPSEHPLAFSMDVSPDTYDPQQLVREVEDARRRLGPRVADMDPGDVILILQSLLRPWGTGRRYFLRQVKPGVYVA